VDAAEALARLDAETKMLAKRADEAAARLPALDATLAEAERAARDADVALAQAMSRQAAELADARVAEAAAIAAKARHDRALRDQAMQAAELKALGDTAPLRDERDRAIKARADALDSAEAAFMTLALTIEARDPTTNGHCERLARHAVALGKALGLGEEDLQALNRGGFLHDVGKVGVADAVLLKPGPLTPEEFELMKRHPDIGDSLCAPLQSLRAVRPIVRFHHERLDGSGYPLGLRGEEVPLLGSASLEGHPRAVRGPGW